MESAVAYYERRHTEELLRAELAYCDEAETAHIALAEGYRDRAVAERMRALESYRAHLSQQGYVNLPEPNASGRGAQ